MNATKYYTAGGFSPSSDTASSIADQAPRACEKCRSSKRRCDKTLPQCTRCTRLNAKCVYLADALNPNPANNGAPVVIFQPQSLLHDVMRGSDPLDDITATRLLDLIALDTPPGEKLDWLDAVRSYFDYVQSWYQVVVHRALFEQRIASLQSAADSPPDQPYSPPLTNTPSDKVISVSRGLSAAEHMSRELGLLIVAMYLVVRVRATVEGNERPMFDGLYRTVKHVLGLALLESPKPKLEVVQAGALIALYEYGHGDSTSAYRSLSEALAAGRVIGVQPGRVFDDGPPSASGSTGIEQEQKAGLWWTMFILDQIIHRDENTKHLPFVLESPDANTLLPGPVLSRPIPSHHGGYDVKYLCEPLTPPPRYLSVNTQINARGWESFQLSTKTACLLHRALRHDYDLKAKAPRSLPDTRTFADLDREIRDTTLALLQDDIDWMAALDCFAMCVSALFTLYLPFLPVLESKTSTEIMADDELKTALAALKFAMQISTDISCKLNPIIGSKVDSVKYLAAPAAPTCYLVVLAYAGLRKVFPEDWNKCQEGIVEKFESLRFFNFRWGIAEKMMRQLEDVAGFDRHKYFKLASSASPSPVDDAMDMSR